MINIKCVVQEGCVPEQVRPKLVAEMARISISLLGGSPDDIKVEFTDIPKGFGFIRGGEPSTTSVIVVRIPVAYEQNHRGQLLREFGVMWSEVTGCSVDEFVASARNQINQS